jgi:large subunit ribosomal protein L20
MSRVKRSMMANKRRKNLLARAKGFKGKSGNIYRIAKERLLKAESNAYKSRRLIKRDFRSLWITRINGALDAIGSELNYSKFINLLNKSDLELNRKMISEIAIEDINVFKAIVARVEGKAVAKSEKLEKVEKPSKKEEQNEVKKEKSETPKPKTLKSENVETTEDDLKVVEGIGPAIEKLLHEAGIKTYQNLSDATYETLKKVLADAGARFAIHDPLTWSKQSKLAAEGKFEELETLKKELVNGK